MNQLNGVNTELGIKQNHWKIENKILKRKIEQMRELSKVRTYQCSYLVIMFILVNTKFYVNMYLLIYLEKMTYTCTYIPVESIMYIATRPDNNNNRDSYG